MTNHAENLNYGASKVVMDFAKDLRKRMTLAEEMLWPKLRNGQCGGYKFRRQHAIDRFIADFYCHQVKLVVELDGGIHKSHQQKEYDESRTAEMAYRGIKVIRFTNDEVYQSRDKVLEEIKRVCDERRPHPDPNVEGSRPLPGPPLEGREQRGED